MSNMIPIDLLCAKYEVKVTFLHRLNEAGLVEFVTVKRELCIPEENLKEVEQMIRLHHELEINIEGIDAIIALLRRIRDLQDELHQTKNRLGLYE